MSCKWQQEVDLLSGFGIWETDELELRKRKVSKTKQQLF